MNKFKVGDKVRVKNNVGDYFYNKYIGKIFPVIKVEENGSYRLGEMASECGYAELGVGGWLEKELERAVKDLDYLEEGDILVDKNGEEYKVLGVHKYLVHLSCSDDLNEYFFSYTIKELKDASYKIKDQPDEVLEVTLDEIADKFDVDVKNLKVKKDK